MLHVHLACIHFQCHPGVSVCSRDSIDATDTFSCTPNGSPLTQSSQWPQAIGTRGDIQPFVALGLRLREAGYRVRLASHAAFRAFVADAGLEFYPLGGDPVTLARCAAQTGGDACMQEDDLRGYRSCWVALCMHVEYMCLTQPSLFPMRRHLPTAQLQGGR